MLLASFSVIWLRKTSLKDWAASLNVLMSLSAFPSNLGALMIGAVFAYDVCELEPLSALTALATSVLLMVLIKALSFSNPPSFSGFVICWANSPNVFLCLFSRFAIGLRPFLRREPFFFRVLRSLWEVSVSVDSEPDVAVVQSVKSESPSEIETRGLDRLIGCVFGVLSKVAPRLVTFLSNSSYSFSIFAFSAFSVVLPSPFCCCSGFDDDCWSAMLVLKVCSGLLLFLGLELLVLLLNFKCSVD